MTQTATIEDVYQEQTKKQLLMVIREDLDVLIDSIEIISYPETMEALRKSDVDIKEGICQMIFCIIGGWLSGGLHGKKSTRISKITQEDHSNACRIK